MTRLALHDGAWSGRRAFVLAGGPSARGFDLSILRGERVVACNAGAAPAAAAGAEVVGVAADRQVVEAFWPAPVPGAALAWLRTEAGWAPPPHVAVLERARPDRWTASLADGLVGADCTGVLALHVADALGASPVYLLGVDLDDPPPGAGHRHPSGHWHDAYAPLAAAQPDRDWGGHAGTHASMRASFARWAPAVRARVVNLNPSSALGCFPRADVEWTRDGAGRLVETGFTTGA